MLPQHQPKLPGGRGRAPSWAGSDGSVAAAVPGWRDEPPGHAILPVLHERFLEARETSLPEGAGDLSPRPAPPYLCQGALLFVQVPGPGRSGGHQRGCGGEGVSRA